MVLKNEFDKVVNEILEIRDIIVKDSQNNTGISNRMRVFEQFKINVIDQLADYE
jgi:hypothetical protein